MPARGCRRGRETDGKRPLSHLGLASKCVWLGRTLEKDEKVLGWEPGMVPPDYSPTQMGLANNPAADALTSRSELRPHCGQQSSWLVAGGGGLARVVGARGDTRGRPPAAGLSTSYAPNMAKASAPRNPSRVSAPGLIQQLRPVFPWFASQPFAHMFRQERDLGVDHQRDHHWPSALTIIVDYQRWLSATISVDHQHRPSASIIRLSTGVAQAGSRHGLPYRSFAGSWSRPDRAPLVPKSGRMSMRRAGAIKCQQPRL